MSDRHNRRDFLKSSALAALGSAAALNSARSGFLRRLPEPRPSVCLRPFIRGFPPVSWGLSA